MLKGLIGISTVHPTRIASAATCNPFLGLGRNRLDWLTA